MATDKKMILGILPSLGGSIESQKRDGREGLFLNYYLPKYQERFKPIRYFSYANEQSRISDGVSVFPNKFGLHRYLYALFFPILYRRELRDCALLRVMHLNGAVPAVIAKILYKVPFVSTYGYDYVRFAAIEGHPIKAIALKLLIPLLLKCANGIIVTTESLRAEVERYIGKPAKVILVPNGVDAKKFAPFAKTPLEHKTARPFRLLTVGRLEKQKNLFFLLDIIEKLKAKKSIELVMIGKGTLADVLKQQARQRELPICFVSSVPYEEIRKQYQEADCFISVSLAEGHPKVLIEAMSAGLPCVVSNCQGNLNMIENDRNGVMLEADDALKWADAVGELLNDENKRNRLGRQARQDIVANYNLCKTLETEVRFLSKCVA